MTSSNQQGIINEEITKGDRRAKTSHAKTLRACHYISCMLLWISVIDRDPHSVQAKDCNDELYRNQYHGD